MAMALIERTTLMWPAIALGFLCWLALRWFDAARDAEARLRDIEEAKLRDVRKEMRDMMDI